MNSVRLIFRNKGAERPRPGPNWASRPFEVKHLRDEPGAGNDSCPITDQTCEKPSPRRVDESQAAEVEANAVR